MDSGFIPAEVLAIEANELLMLLEIPGFVLTINLLEVSGTVNSLFIDDVISDVFPQLAVIIRILNNIVKIRGYFLYESEIGMLFSLLSLF